MKLKIESFQGKRPRVARRLLGATQAEIALDCELLSGDLGAIREHSTVQAVAADTETIYYHNEFDTWHSWDVDVDVARGNVANDLYKRLYVTGDGVPKVIGNGDETYDLGVPAPTKAPTVESRDRSSVDEWTPKWYYFYEEPDGSKSDAGDLGGVSESKPGQEYGVSSFPQKDNASDDARFVPWMEAIDDSGNVIGTVYPNTSIYSDDNDFYQEGAKATLRVDEDSGIKLLLAYDTANSSAVSRAYVYTFVSLFGEEGPPSPPSDIVNVNPSQQAIIGGMEVTVPGDRRITLKRIYRTNPGTGSGTDTAYQFVAEVPIGNGGYDDSILDSELSEVLPTASYYPPPDDLEGIVSHPNGFMAAFSGRDLYFSEPGQPHAWPAEYIQSVDYDIVALGVAGNAIVVMTKGFPYYAAGTHPSQIVIPRVPSNQPCVSKRSKADIGYATLYASTDGLVMVSDGVAKLVTRESYLREHWAGLSPENMVAEVHDQIYYGFSGEHAVSIDFAEGRSAISSFTAQPETLHSDLEDDTLYFVESGEIKEWRGGDDNQELTWRSGQVSSGRDITFGVGRVVCSAYPCTLKVIRDDVTVSTIEVNSNSAFRLPPLERGRYWQIEITATADVQEALISTSMRDL